MPIATTPVPSCPACGAAERSRAVETPTHLHRSSERFVFSRCDECGLVFLDPRPTPESLAIFYGSDYLPHRGPSAWGRWAPLVAAGERALDRRRVRLVRRHSPIDHRSIVLDVGCGRPTFLAELRRRTGCEAWGFDFSAAGWSEDPGAWSGLHLLEGDLETAAPLLPDTVDLITMWHYLEHDFEPRRTLRRLLDHATPSTRLVLEVPDHDSWTRRRHGPYWAGYHTPRHAAAYDAGSLAALLERSGWRPEVIHPNGTLDPYVLWWMGRQERRRIDWSGSLEPRFPAFLAGKLVTIPFFALSRWMRMGVMAAVARPA